MRNEVIMAERKVVIPSSMTELAGIYSVSKRLSLNG
jgi:hypothetical protein